MRIVRAVCLLLAGLLALSCAETSPTAPAAKPPDEAAAIAALKEINEAQTNYIRRHRRYAQTPAELVADYLLTAEPNEDEIGYDFLILLSPDGVSYRVRVTPTTPTARHLFTDQTGIVRAEAGKPATLDSPEI
jgi:hypothetical protein